MTLHNYSPLPEPLISLPLPGSEDDAKVVSLRLASDYAATNKTWPSNHAIQGQVAHMTDLRGNSATKALVRLAADYAAKNQVSQSSDRVIAEQVVCMRGLNEEGAAKALLRLSSYYAAKNNVPWSSDHVGQVSNMRSIKEEGSVPMWINISQGADDDVSNNINEDMELSLYLGVENVQHGLCDARGYKDLSGISFADVAVICNDPERQLTFPAVLHWLLSSLQHHGSSIEWLAHGRAFKITEVDKFFAEVAPRHFCPRDCSLFMGLVEAYGFQRLRCGGREDGSIAFYHERFLRFRPWIASTMELGDHVGGIPIPQAVDRTRAIFHHLDRLPALHDVMVSESALEAHRVLAAGQMPFAVAHAYLPTPPVDPTGCWPLQACANGGGIPALRAFDCRQAVYHCIDSLPVLREFMVPHSTLVERRVLMARQVSGAVAHARLPTMLPAYSADYWPAHAWANITTEACGMEAPLDSIEVDHRGVNAD